MELEITTRAASVGGFSDVLRAGYDPPSASCQSVQQVFHLTERHVCMSESFRASREPGSRRLTPKAVSLLGALLGMPAVLLWAISISRGQLRSAEGATQLSTLWSWCGFPCVILACIGLCTSLLGLRQAEIAGLPQRESQTKVKRAGCIGYITFCAGFALVLVTITLAVRQAHAAVAAGSPSLRPEQSSRFLFWGGWTLFCFGGVFSLLDLWRIRTLRRIDQRTRAN
jgi:hypothetical protein